MTTLTDLVAAVVVHSSAVAFSHFGVALDAPRVEQRAMQTSERVVARSPRKPEKLSGCVEGRRGPARLVKA